MKLYINKDIVADSEKINYWLSGDDAVSYNDISCALEYMREYYPNDTRVDVELHSCGGDCVEGYAIYDALRASGYEISCKVVGKCASMATIILLSAPVERRTMYEHAQLLIHEPYYPQTSSDLTLSRLDALKDNLATERERMLKVYEERTGATREELEEQITRGDWFGADRALELGFVGSIVPAVSARATEKDDILTTNSREEMTEQKSALKSALNTIAHAFGFGFECSPVGMVLTDVNGTEFNVEREDGEPQVGDNTDAHNGEYVLPDGRTIVVTDGVITEIKPAEETTDEQEQEQEQETAKENGEDEPETDEDAPAEPSEESEKETEESDEESEDEKDKKIAELEKRIEELEAEIAEAQGNAKNGDDVEILGMVARAGGLSWLKRQTGDYVPDRRTNAHTNDASASLSAQIEAQKAKNASFVPFYRRK